MQLFPHLIGHCALLDPVVSVRHQEFTKLTLTPLKIWGINDFLEFISYPYTPAENITYVNVWFGNSFQIYYISVTSNYFLEWIAWKLHYTYLFVIQRIIWKMYFRILFSENLISMVLELFSQSSPTGVYTSTLKCFGIRNVTWKIPTVYFEALRKGNPPPSLYRRSVVPRVGVWECIDSALWMSGSEEGVFLEKGFSKNVHFLV